MGKGDKRSKRGKILAQSYGKTRLRLAKVLRMKKKSAKKGSR